MAGILGLRESYRPGHLSTAGPACRSPLLGGRPWPQPQRGPRRLHGLLGHGQQLGLQGAQVDLDVQAGAERLDELGGVVAAGLKRRSTACWTRRRAGWNAAATVRTAAATARLESWGSSQPSPGTHRAVAGAEQQRQ
jgi:hypothetical protein